MARFFQYQAKTDPLVPIAAPVAAVVFVACMATEIIFPRSFIYQSHVDPIIPPAVVIVPDNITVSASSPVIYQNKFIYQSYAKPVLPPTTVTTSEDQWHQPWSEPTRTRKFNTALQDVGTPDVALPPPVLSSQWYEPWVDPVRLKQGLSVTLQQSLAWSTFTPAAAVVTDIKWSYGWAEPVRQKPGLATNLQQSLAWSTFTPAVVTATFVESFSSDVIYPRSFIYQAITQPATTPAPTPTTPTFFNLTQGDTGLIFQKTLIYQVNTDPIGVTAPFIDAPWVDPVRRKGPHVSLLPPFAWSTFTPAVVVTTDIRWSYPWSEPVRTRRFGPQLQDIGAPDVVNPPPVLVSQWFFPLSEPVRTRKFGAHLQDTGAPDVTLPPPVLVSQWYEPWTDPVRRIGFSVALQQEPAWSNFTPPAVVTADIRWIYQWSEPTRRVGLPAALQQLPSWANFTPSGITAPDLGPWSEPVRTRTLPVAVATSGQIQTIQPPTVLVSQWYESWVDPVRTRSYSVSLQQVLAWGIFTPSGEIITEDKWHYPWSEPVRTRTLPVAVATSGQIQTLQPPTILVSQWYEPWVDPVKLKPGLSVALHQSLIWSNFTPAVAAVTDIKWSYGWAEPVRVRQFPTSQQQSLAFVALLKNASNIAAPYYPWSEPVRIKQGLKTHLQSFTSLVTPPQPNFIRTINWYQAWSEPVRQKKGLRPDLQQFFDTDHNRPAAPAITITMSAFEINTDMFLAGLFTGNPAVNANVSIKEIPAIRGAAVSLEET